MYLVLLEVMSASHLQDYKLAPVPTAQTLDGDLPLGQSLYLDFIRFGMALEVMIGHASANRYTGRGFLWQIDPFRHLQTAVIGFFVLSGLVIAFASKTRETGSMPFRVEREGFS